MSDRTRRGRRLSIRSPTASRASRGVTFGNFLIKQVVEEIRRELPRIETFVTLSPVPGLRAWIEVGDDPAVERLAKAAREAAHDERWPKKSETAQRLRTAVEPLAAYYFLKARRDDGRVIDPVARFHLGNGAKLERINWMGDLSRKGVAEILRPHGQLSLRSRGDRAQSRGLRQRARGRRLDLGQEGFAQRPFALGSAGAAGAGELSASAWDPIKGAR